MVHNLYYQMTLLANCLQPPGAGPHHDSLPPGHGSPICSHLCWAFDTHKWVIVPAQTGVISQWFLIHFQSVLCHSTVWYLIAFYGASSHMVYVWCILWSAMLATVYPIPIVVWTWYPHNLSLGC